MSLKYFLFKPLINCSDAQFAQFQQAIDGRRLADGSELEVFGGRPGVYFAFERRTPVRRSMSSPTQEELSAVVAAARLVAVSQGLPEDCPVMVLNRRSGLLDDEPTLVSKEQTIQTEMSKYRQGLVAVRALGCTIETVQIVDNCFRQLSGTIGLVQQLGGMEAAIGVTDQLQVLQDARARSAAVAQNAVERISERLQEIEQTDRDLGSLIDRYQAEIDNSASSSSVSTKWNRYRVREVDPQVQTFRADLELALNLERRLRNIGQGFVQEKSINIREEENANLDIAITKIAQKSVADFGRFAETATESTRAWCESLLADLNHMRSEFSIQRRANMVREVERLVASSAKFREVRSRFDEVLSQLEEVSEVIGGSGFSLPVPISEQRRQMDEKLSVFSRAAFVARGHLSDVLGRQSDTYATVGSLVDDLVGRVEPIHRALAPEDGTPGVLSAALVGQISTVLAGANDLLVEVRLLLGQTQDMQSRLANLEVPAISRPMGADPDLGALLDEVEQVSGDMAQILSVTTISLDEALDLQERIEEEASWQWIDSEDGGADPERVLDATAILGMRGHGRWEQFVNACDIANRHGATRQLDPKQFSNVLSRLGAIEVDFDSSPPRWTVAPVTLLPLKGRFTRDLKVFGLFGLNAASKLESIAALMPKAQISHIQQPRDVAPPVPLLTVPSTDSSGVETDQLLQALGVRVPSNRLGDLLPDISAFTQSLHLRRAFRPSFVLSARVWNGDRWVNIATDDIVPRLEQAGLFSVEERADPGTRSWIWRNGDEWWGGEWAALLHRAFQTDPRRTSSARFYRTTDPNGPSNGAPTLRVKDAWRWPGLYERALVLTTGTLPGRSQNRILDYPAVDEAMAKHLCEVLGIIFEVREEEN